MPQNEIMINDCRFLGRVREDPLMVGNCVFFFLRTKFVQKDLNGQYTEIPQDIPCLVKPDGPINPVKMYVQAGKQLYILAHFEEYQDEEGYTHPVFTVKNITFGIN